MKSSTLYLNSCRHLKSELPGYTIRHGERHRSSCFGAFERFTAFGVGQGSLDRPTWTLLGVCLMPLLAKLRKMVLSDEFPPDMI